MNKKEWIIAVVVMIVIAIVVSLLTAQMTGNVIKLNQDRYGKYLVYTQAEIDAKLKNLSLGSSGISSYMDPKQCHFKVFTHDAYSYDNFSTYARCEDDQFIGSVTHILCPDYLRDNRVIDGTGWFEGTLPLELTYTCVGSDGARKSPASIYAYCCDIASSVSSGEVGGGGGGGGGGGVLSTAQKHTSTYNSATKKVTSS